MRTRRTQQRTPTQRPLGSWRKDALVVIAIALVLVLIGGRQFRDEYFLSQRSQPTEATVISKISGHGVIEYEYFVNGSRYEGTTPATSTGKPFDKVAIGDKFVVNFDPLHPGVSGTIDTRKIVMSTGPLLLLVVIVASAIVFFRHRWRKL
jgi:hypothetical protein